MMGGQQASLLTPRYRQIQNQKNGSKTSIRPKMTFCLKPDVSVLVLLVSELDD